MPTESIEFLSYEETLSAFQGLLGERVMVILSLHNPDRAVRSLARFDGVLSLGEDVDWSIYEGQPTGIAPGEAIHFRVGDGFFVMRKDDFVQCRLMLPQRAYEFEVGPVTVAVLPLGAKIRPEA